MNIRIYQVNMKRDTNNVAFMRYEFLEKLQGSQSVDSKIYDKVFDGEVDCQTLEDVFQMFNLNHPEGYKDRSLSVSDVVEVMEDPMHPHCFYFCDSIGFKSIDFEPKDCQLGRTFTDMEKKNMISVLLVEPNKYPKMIEIEDSLEPICINSKDETGKQPSLSDRIYESDSISTAITTSQFFMPNYMLDNCRVRKLTPKECLRLMTFDDADYEKIKAAGISDSAIYKQAGNSIVVKVLMAIFKELL